MKMPIEAGSFVIRAKFEENVIAGMDDLKNALKGTGIEITSIRKAAEAMTNTFTKTYSTWLNIMFLAQNLNKVFGGLRDLVWQVYLNAIFMDLAFGMLSALEPILDPLTTAVMDLSDAFYDLPEDVQFGISGTVLAIGGLLAAIPFITNIALLLGPAGLGASIASAGGLFAWLGVKVSAVVGTISGILSGLASLLTGPVIAAIFLLVVAWTQNAEGISRALGGLWDTFKSIFGNIIGIIGGFIDFLIAVCTGDSKRAFDALKSIVKNAIALIISIFWGIPKALFDVFWQVEYGIGKFFWETLPKFAVELGGKIAGAMFDVGGKLVRSFVDGIMSLGGAVANALWGLIPEPFKGWIKGAAGAVGGAVSWVAGLGKAFMGLFGMQAGGIVTRPTIALLGERGPEAVIPLAGRGGQNIYGQNQVNFSPTTYVNVSSIASPGDIERLKRELNERWALDYKRLIGGW